ncbi:Roquin-2 [Frankliniella fusca]|uniref:Roquin-2 n=1 Tax=Frankliniella fusca TaxID=407009 RepID=A0AAE1H0U8_9NEOP|nr:Roquin-2 [Frankliniella fusca]
MRESVAIIEKINYTSSVNSVYSLTIMDALECEVCLDQFDSSTRKPKILSCGHTICLTCVVELHRKAAAPNDAFLCPKCRKEIQSSPSALIDNFYILSLIQDTPKAKSISPAPVRFWCTECSEVADKTCEEKHTICRLQKHRGRVLKDVIDTLERAVSVRGQLADLLRETNQKFDALLEKQANEIAERQALVQASLSLVCDSLELTGPEWEEVNAATLQARQTCEESLPADEQSLELLRTARRCEVTVHGEEGITWCADLRVQSGHADEGDGETATFVLALLAALQRSRLLSVKNPKPVSDNTLGKGCELGKDANAIVEQKPCQQQSRGKYSQTEGERVAKRTNAPGSPKALGRDKLQLTKPTETFPIPTGGKAAVMTPAALHVTTSPQSTMSTLQDEEEFWDMLGGSIIPTPNRGGSNFETGDTRVLDVSVLSSSAGRRKEKDDLLLNFKSTVTVLRGLQCSVDRAWACALLGVFSRQLESLELQDACEEHLRTVTFMPRLRKLRLQSKESNASALSGFALPGPRPAQLQELELDVPLSDVPIICRLFGGGVPTLRLVLRHGTDLDALLSLVAGLKEQSVQRGVLRHWPGPAGAGLGPVGLRKIVLMPRTRQGGRVTEHGELRCTMWREVFTSGLPSVQVQCSECGSGKGSVEAQAAAFLKKAAANISSHFFQ